MYGTYRRLKSAAFTLAFATGMAVPAALAADHSAPVQDTSNQVSKSKVRRVQKELKNRGYYEGPIDGATGAQTRMAIQKFQRSENIVETGTLNDATLKSLGVENARRESQGEASRSAEEPSVAPEHAEAVPPAMVRSAQRELKRYGYYHGDADGAMGPATRDALRQYQQEQRLSANGRLDRGETARSLGINR